MLSRHDWALLAWLKEHDTLWDKHCSSTGFYMERNDFQFDGLLNWKLESKRSRLERVDAVAFYVLLNTIFELYGIVDPKECILQFERSMRTESDRESGACQLGVYWFRNFLCFTSFIVLNYMYFSSFCHLFISAGENVRQFPCSF